MSADAPADAALLLARARAGFSVNYDGNIWLQQNRSADIPASESCSMFVTGLPADVTTHQLLAPIRNMGRVFASHINRPQPERGHLQSAAKIVFFERRAAARFFAWSNVQGYVVGGRRARVVYNRIRAAEDGRSPAASRVVCVAGPPAVVSEAVLLPYFATKFSFQIDEVLDHGPGPDGRALVEFRFGSFRCQAQSAKLAVDCELRGLVTAFYGVDPCE